MLPAERSPNTSAIHTHIAHSPARSVCMRDSGRKRKKRWNRMRALFIEKPQAVFNKENLSVCSKRLREERNRKSKWLTSTSPVRSLYLSRMIGSAGFSFRVLERSLKGCSGAGEGMDRTISFSPKLWLRLWEPLHKYMGQWQMGVSMTKNMKQLGLKCAPSTNSLILVGFKKLKNYHFYFNDCKKLWSVTTK